MKKRKLHLKKKKFCFILVILFSTILIFYHFVCIVIWCFDNSKITSEIKEIQEETPIIEKEIFDGEKEQQDEQSSFNPYFDFIKTNYMEVNFSKLKEMNKEVVAWIFVRGTNINYPVVQHSDNQYYLNHSFSRSKNEAGWVFMDYRNQIQLYMLMEEKMVPCLEL